MEVEEGAVKYRVWAKNASSKHPLSIMTDWQGYGACQRFIIGRWGHWPPFAFISRCCSAESFVRYNGN